MKSPCDLMVIDAGELVTLAGPAPRRGARMREFGVIAEGAIAVSRGRIVAVGSTGSLRRVWKPKRTIDAKGRLVTPGLVDAHTHIVWGGDRSAEFGMRCEGKSYLEIAAAGGGILSTVRATREASAAELRRSAQARLDEMAAHGTTTAEVKSGYGLDWSTEKKQLDVISKLRGPRVVPTFLGAHTAPDGNRDAFLASVIGMMPRVRAKFCDVFCDAGAFTEGEARRVLAAGREHGLALKIHADEFEAVGGTEMAVALGATSADHLGKVTESGIRALAGSETVAVLLPATSLFLKLDFAPARRMIDAGCAVALGTDYNPGSSHTGNMQLVLTLACAQLRMTPCEAIAAATINAAHATGVSAECGSLEPGKSADFVVWDVPDRASLPYAMGFNRAVEVVARGVSVL